MSDVAVPTGHLPLPLLEMCNGFWVSKILSTALELDLFTHAETNGTTTDELAVALDIAARPAEMMLTACTSIGLLELRDGRYHDTELARDFLIPGKPDFFGGWIRMADRRLFPAWGRLLEAVRGDHPTSWDPGRDRSPFESEDSSLVEGFWDGMHSLSLATGRALAQVCDFAGTEQVLDVGGGSGACAIELCRAHPDLRVVVYDLPFVAEIAKNNIGSAGLTGRASVVGGDMFADVELPRGHDTILLSMVLHDWGEATNRELLAKCFAALPSGGRLIISELLVDDDKTGPTTAALMSVNMLVETEQGRNYTGAEYRSWLLDTGFRDPVRIVPLPAVATNAAVIARKP